MKDQAEIITAIRDLGQNKARLRDHDEHGGAAMFRMSGTFAGVVWSNGHGWDHVSISLRKRTPKYQEMKWMKRFFFKPDEWAVEYHPPAGDYVSVNDNVLHLWRPHDLVLPTPPKIMV